MVVNRKASGQLRNIVHTMPIMEVGVGLLSWLFGKRGAQSGAVAARHTPGGASLRSPKKPYVVWDDDRFPVDVVGEGARQDVLLEHCGGYNRNGHYKICAVTLVREPTNDHDPNAVVVLLDGAPVGYLSKGHARRFQKALREHGVNDQPVMCSAVITGGWRTNQYDSGHFGVRLGMPGQGHIKIAT